MTRADQIAEEFERFDRDNPAVWLEFRKFADQMVERCGQASAKAVFERIRWETMLRTRSQDGLKVRNAFTPWYARLYNAYRGERLIRVNELRSRHQAPAQDPAATLGLDPPAGPEEEDRDRLTRILDRKKGESRRARRQSDMAKVLGL